VLDGMPLEASDPRDYKNKLDFTLVIVKMDWNEQFKQFNYFYGLIPSSTTVLIPVRGLFGRITVMSTDILRMIGALTVAHLAALFCNHRGAAAIWLSSTTIGHEVVKIIPL
jgi:hypothetical protein